MQVRETAEFRLRHIASQGSPVVRALAKQNRMASRDAIPEPVPDPFLVWIFQRAGIGLDHYRVEPLHSRLNACFRALRCTDPERAQEMVLQRPELLQTSLNVLLPGVSSFFRDGPVFDNLRKLLPGLRSGRVSGGTSLPAPARRIVLVDDDEDTRQLVGRVLLESGIEVVSATSSDEGLQKTLDVKPDVLVSDIGMPGEDGYQFIGRLRAQGGWCADLWPPAAIEN